MLGRLCGGSGAGCCDDVHETGSFFDWQRVTSASVEVHHARHNVPDQPADSQYKTPLPRGLHNPVAVERQRRHAGQAAAAGAAVRPCRPADDPDDGRAALPVLKHRAAGIAGTRAEPAARALPDRIDQANLQCPGLAGGNQAGDANGAAATALAANGHADAGDAEAAAGDNRYLRRAKNRRDFPLRRRFELQQRHVGGGAMGRHRLHIEGGMNADVFHVPQLRLLVGAIFDDFVDRAGLHAMRRRQHQSGCDQSAGAEIAARADDGDDGARHAAGLRRAAADDSRGGRGQERRQRRRYENRFLHPRSNSPRR